MSNNNVKLLAGAGGAILVILLCVLVAAASYSIGRRSAPVEPAGIASERVEQAPATVAPVEPAVPLEVIVPTEPAATSTAAPTSPPAEVQRETTPAPPISAETESLIEADGQFAETDLELLWEVWEILQRTYDGELPGEQELSYAVVRGLVDGLGDPHTRFIDPPSAVRMQERFEGSYDGIGAYVQENDQGLTEIVRPIAGSPAEVAGLRPGDTVIAVDGESVVGKALEEVISYILGPAGTEVIITFVRGDIPDPFDVALTRASIVIPVVTFEMLDDEIAYVELASFNSLATEQLQLALEELMAENPRGLILDLRNNAGGFLTQSVTVADLFLPDSVVLYERNRQEEINEVFYAADGQIAEDIPLVVLINEFSASAAEIVAGAIRDHGRGVLIGETTFGKGSVQLPHTLSDGSQLNVTIARWYTPANTSIDAEGVAPDIEIELDESVLLENDADDVQLQRAIDYFLNGE
jgi:carboxyl-terminal processing protease